MMDLVEAIVTVLGAIFALLFVIGFLHIWAMISEIRHSAQVHSSQLDQLLRVHGLKDPKGDRERMMKAGRAT